jgi:uncharacterized coiled-coil protein SlyX
MSEDEVIEKLTEIVARQQRSLESINDRLEQLRSFVESLSRILLSTTNMHAESGRPR